MNKSDIIQAYINLGNELKQIPEEIISEANLKNPWFTPDFIRLSARNWSLALMEEKIQFWLKDVQFNLSDQIVGLITAGNIPFVGLHDVLSIIASGKRAQIKMSSNDEVLMNYALNALIRNIPILNDRISTEGKMKGIHFLIATGSNNSARYFEYYFKDVKQLIRKNRTSLAVLTGEENEKTLLELADDIYMYFGLGCRNVTHLVLPRNIELKPLYEAFDRYMNHVNHHKYYNNYIYHKSILLMNLDKHYDNGFMLFQEKRDFNAPIATLNYHYYDTIQEVNEYILEHAAHWQCIVSQHPDLADSIPFGNSQSPELWHYADQEDTLKFLNSL